MPLLEVIMGWMIGRKIRQMRDGMYCFWCPGCDGVHAFWTKNGPVVDGVEQNWTFNGDGDKPTITPSLDVARNMPDFHCHSFVRNGLIEFLSDSHHALKGQTVPIPDWDDH
jgi:hypothetical protein